jgi:hypothetical protein
MFSQLWQFLTYLSVFVVAVQSMNIAPGLLPAVVKARLRLSLRAKVWAVDGII